MTKACVDNAFQRPLGLPHTYHKPTTRNSVLLLQSVLSCSNKGRTNMFFETTTRSVTLASLMCLRPKPQREDKVDCKKITVKYAFTYPLYFLKWKVFFTFFYPSLWANCLCGELDTIRDRTDTIYEMNKVAL